MNRKTIAGLLFLFFAALAFRVPQLDSRPMHNDEAVNAIKLRDLMQAGEYRYDPSEYHGPTLIYPTLAWMKLTGTTDFNSVTEAKLRTVTVLFGSGLVLLLWGLADGLGSRAILLAGLLIALSPAMVFYSRYYIHEMLLVFFAFLLIVCGWRYYCKPTPLGATMCGLSFGLMHATKETFVLSIAAMFGALVLQRFLKPLQTANHPKLVFSSSHLVLAVVAWLVVTILLFTSFFQNRSGWLDSFRTYLPWMHRVQGASPHIHGFGFYLERLLWFHSSNENIWSEGLIFLMALPAMIVGIKGGRMKGVNTGLVRFLTLYTLLLTLIYSLIGYKTPWCLLNFSHGYILLAGVGGVLMLDSLGNRIQRFAFCGIIVVGCIRLATQAWVGSTSLSSSPGNPYVYAQTSMDVHKLIDRVLALGKMFSDEKDMPIQVAAPDSEYWPLPYYLRSFGKVGWHDGAADWDRAPVMILSTALKTDLESSDSYVMLGIFELRPQTFFCLYVEKHLYQQYLASGKAREIPD